MSVPPDCVTYQGTQVCWNPKFLGKQDVYTYCQNPCNNENDKQDCLYRMYGLSDPTAQKNVAATAVYVNSFATTSIGQQCTTPQPASTLMNNIATSLDYMTASIATSQQRQTAQKFLDAFSPTQ